jgi:hypothetical protein
VGSNGAMKVYCTALEAALLLAHNLPLQLKPKNDARRLVFIDE